MTIDFYYSPGSAPCMSVLLTAKVLGIDLNLKLINLQAGDQLTPEYLKLNPQHTIPTINDNGFSLWESRAICTYLVNAYGKDDSLYPKEPKARALVDQRLYFDIGTLYARFGDYYYPFLFLGLPEDPSKLERINEVMKFLDGFLQGQTYVAGKNLTVADLAILSSVTIFEVVEYDLSPYKNIGKWFAHLKSTVPGYKEANEEGCIALKALLDRLQKK